MTIIQDNLTDPVPFYVAQNLGDFHGAPGAKPTVMLSKNAGDPVPAFGVIVDKGAGLYWLMPDARDRDVVGPVAMLVTAPSGDIAPPQSYYVKAPSHINPPQTINFYGSGLSATDSANLANVASYLKLLVNATVPQSEKIP